MSSEPLRIVVTGLTNTGKSTLLNAIVGRNLLPVGFQSETSLLTYIVPETSGSSIPSLHAYARGPNGTLTIQSVASGTDEIYGQIQLLNQMARESDVPTCTECRVESPLRTSLCSVGDWRCVHFLDIGGPDDILNETVQDCADLAYSLCHQVIVCVKHDQTRSSSLARLLDDLKAKAPHLFTKEYTSSNFHPIVFVITQVDQIQRHLEVESNGVEKLHYNLRQTLIKIFGDENFALANDYPIVAISALNALAGLQPTYSSRLYEWSTFEDILRRIATSRSHAIATSRLARASTIHTLLRQNLSLIPQDEWPFYTTELWEQRWTSFVNIATGSVVVASVLGTGIAAGVYMTVGCAASTSAASGAFAMARVMGCAGGTTALTAAATCTAVTAASALGGSANILSLAGCHASASWCLMAGVSSVAGSTITDASSVGAQRAEACLKDFKFTADADDIKDSQPYCDVVFYPIDSVWCNNCVSHCLEQGTLACLRHPFQLLNRIHLKSLYFDGRSAGCFGPARRDQLWWAIPAGPHGSAVLQNGACDEFLRADSLYNRNLFDARLTVTCSDQDIQSWEILPGQTHGTIRLRNTHHGQFLYFDGWSVGCHDEEFPDQEWTIVPKMPLYIGEHVSDSPSGCGQIFWPNGSPAFKGQMQDGVPQRGFFFDERAVCHGHFQVLEKEELQPEGFQPERLDEGNTCIVCKESPPMLFAGVTLSPCGHGVTCEQCAEDLQECPFCRTPVKGLKHAS